MNPKNSNSNYSTFSVPYAPIPTNPTPQNVVVLQYFYRPRTRRLRRCLLLASGVVLLALAFFLLFPSDPTLQLSRIHLNNVKVVTSPAPTLYLSFSVTVKVRNADFFSVDYDDLVVSVGYRGRELGFVRSTGGEVKARGSSYVNATLDLNGLEVVHDAFYLIEDLVRGVIPFDTVSKVKGHLGLFFIRIPVKGKVACAVYVNANNQTVVHQDCYPE